MALVCSFASSSSSSRIRISVCGNERGRRLAMAITSFVYRLPIALHIHSSHIHEGAHHQQQNHPTEHQTQEQNQQQNRPLPKRLVPIPITRRSNHTLVARPFVSQKPILISDTIRLTELEFRLFTTLKSVLGYYNLKTQLRVAGGWVRDKLLGKNSGDIDIALDDMLGKTFCRKLMGYLRDLGIESNGFGVIRSNPMQAKHLEVARMEVFGVMIDFVNLRSAGYTEKSFMFSAMPEFGTPIEDAFRRDLTINSLFYNINSGIVEDPTGRGLSDLRAGVITTPLRAKDTFMDDPLRALRALRFVATLDYELHPEAKDAIDTDLKLALTTKISRERIGAEIERIFRSSKPVKAMEILVEKQLFPIIFKPPPELEIILPDGIDRRCLHALASVVEVVNHFGSAKLLADHRKSLYFAAFLSPLRTFEYQHKDKLMLVSTVIIKETLKLRSIDAAMVKTLHETANNFSSIRKLLLRMDEISQQETSESSSPENTSEISFSYDKHKIERHLQEMRGLWRASMLLAVILEDEDNLFSMSDEKRKLELIRRSNVCLYVEEAIVKLGLDKVKGTNPFIYKIGAVDHG